MGLSKINGFNAILIVLLLLLVVNVSAETTFFDQDDSFIMGNSATGGSIAESQSCTSASVYSGGRDYYCGDGICTTASSAGEDCKNCPEDCGVCPGEEFKEELVAEKPSKPIPVEAKPGAAEELPSVKKVEIKQTVPLTTGMIIFALIAVALIALSIRNDMIQNKKKDNEDK
jgi:hypothetical protein